MLFGGVLGVKEAAVAFNVVAVVPFVGPFSLVAIGAMVSLMLWVIWGKRLFSRTMKRLLAASRLDILGFQTREGE